jgi:hypothetical protein
MAARCDRARAGGDIVSVRTRLVLQRLPRHLFADDAGKRFGAVADALGAELETKTSQLGRVQRSHALEAADEERDLLLLAALHGLRDEDFALLRTRVDAVRAAAAAVVGDEDAAAVLPALLGLQPDTFAPFPDEGADTGPARRRLAVALRALASYGSELDLLRTTIGTVVARHRDGNGTPAGLLGAAAAHLQLELLHVTHADDRFWHIARCRDRMRLARPEPTGDETRLLAAEDVLALEENPFQGKEIDPAPRRRGDVFRVLRGGLEEVTVSVRVRGLDDRTVQPMVVNIDSGHGVTFAGTVPAGEELRFESDGRVTLGAESVARRSYGFRGGVFADAHASHSNDFVFDRATFVVSEPVPDALDPDAPFPHAEGLVPPITMSLGESRWAFFVRAAHFGRDDPEPPRRLAVPLINAGVFDAAVFADPADPAGEVGFDWQEREPFAVTVWIPMRFSELDEAGELPARERVRLLLARHRAAGVHLYCSYADDRWNLGEGLVREQDTTDPRGLVLVGTRLWPDAVDPVPPD